MDKNEIRVGIIGAGTNTRARHIPGLRAIGGVRIVGVANRSRESSERAAKELDIPKAYDNWQDLIVDRDIDAVVIGTWPCLHAPATLFALEAGKHVLCEARMSATLDESRAMLNAARLRPKLTAQVVPSPFTLRVDRTIQRLLAEGFLGNVYAVEVRAGGAFLDPDAPLHWRQDPDLSGINTMSLGIWYEAVMRWVGEATRVLAMGKTFVKMRKTANGTLQPVRIPDHIDVIADMACGAQSHFMISNAAGLAGAPEAYLFGSEGTLRFCDDKLYGGKRGDRELHEIAIPSTEEGGWRVEAEFINAIRGLEPVTHTTFQDGVKYMEFTEAAVRSMATGKTVSILA